VPWQEGDKKSKVSETMFPQADLKELNIEYCMRFLPHHQDTGGFFVCVLEKVRTRCRNVYSAQCRGLADENLVD
jgi:hypothetical protein